MDFVINNPYFNWDKIGLSCNPNINISVLKLNMPRAINQWYWFWISLYIPIYDVFNKPELPCCKEGLTKSGKLSVVLMLTVDMPNSPDIWNMKLVSEYIPMYEVINIHL